MNVPDYIPADFASKVMWLHEARDCKEAARAIEAGRVILRQLRRKGSRMPSPEMLARWKKSLKSFKKHCRRK